MQRPRARAACQRLTLAILLLGLAAGCRAAIDPSVLADAQTSAAVKTALINDPDLGTRPITVRVARGVVELSGSVRSAAEAERAATLARGVAGVMDVKNDLQVGADLSAPGAVNEAGPPAEEIGEIQPNPVLFALGLSLGASVPRAERLHSRIAVSPLIKMGSGSGLGVALGFDWYQADVQSASAAGETITRVHVKPIMAGIGYTIASERMSLSPSIVGGYAFNSLTVTDVGAAAGLPVEVGNSLAWRVGASAWFDVGHRLALNVSGGYLKTGLRLTVFEAGRLEKRDTRGDTALVHAGLAYRLF